MSGNYNRKDHLYTKAKEEGYRSRAAYKLKELNQKFNLIKPGFKILDLGAWPGGWLQVAAEISKGEGLIVGIDLVEIDSLPQSNVKLITGDANDPEVAAQALAYAGGPFDTVISDMSPKLSGIPEVDRAGAVGLNELTLSVCQRMLRAGGNTVMKVFKGNETEQFVKTLRPLFNKVTRVELDATRKTSNEFYVVALGFKGSL